MPVMIFETLRDMPVRARAVEDDRVTEALVTEGEGPLRSYQI